MTSYPRFILGRARIGVTLALLLAPGCVERAMHEAYGPEPQVQSGARLRAQFVVAPGEARVFAGYYDALLGMRCEVFPASDGSWRCVPAQRTNLHTRGDNTYAQMALVFTDPDCTEWTYRSPESCGDPPPVLFFWMDDYCRRRVDRIVALEGPLPPETLYRGSGLGSADCTSLTEPDGYRYYRLAEESEVALEALARLYRTFSHSGSRLRPEIFVDAYGTVGPRRGESLLFLSGQSALWHDTILDDQLVTPCMIKKAVNGEQRCLPVGGRISGYSDEDCQNQVSLADDCLPAGYINELAPPSSVCDLGGSLRVYRPERRLQLSTVYGYFTGGGGGCNRWSLDATRTYLEVGDELPPESLVRIEETHDATGGRLRARYQSSEDGFQRELGSFWDTERQEICHPAMASDGRIRCLPFDGRPNRFYRDASCTRPVWLLGLNECTPAPRTATLETAGCPSVAAVHAVGAMVPYGDSYIMDSDSGCEPLSGPTDMALEVGDEISPSAFVPLEIITE